MPFINELSLVLKWAWQIFINWWWIPLPFILWRVFKFHWRWWRIDLWLKKIEVILLEIRIPRDVLKPIRAMETVMSGIRQAMYKPPDWWETWIDGEVQLSCSFEVAAFDGATHFFIRIPKDIRTAVESIVYSQYPDAEIFEARDYTKFVPQDIPNDEWDMWASEYKLLKANSYPIKTYTDFETEHEAKEEKRIDPMSGLLETMARVKIGEQLWVQIIAEPITNDDEPWITEGSKLKDLLARRVAKEKPSRPLLLEAADILILGKMPEEKEEQKELLPPEMKLTPGERDIIVGVERKIAKPAFKANIRFITLGKKGIFDRSKIRGVFAYFAFFLTENLNGLVPWGQTMTKIHKSRFLPFNRLYDRRLYFRKRNLFKRYARRDNPYFPRHNTFPGSFVLNVEEMASLFHFPGRIAAPAPFMPRVESKKGEAPADLPTEE